MTHTSPLLLPLDEPVLRQTLEAWRDTLPELQVLALLPEAEKDRLPLLQSLCRQLGVSLAGGIFPALLTTDGFVTSGVWLLRLDPGVSTFLIPDLEGDPVTAAARITELAGPRLSAEALRPGGRPTLYLMVDALLQHIATMLDALYLGLADRVNYAGVAAGSESFQPMPCLFDQSQAIGYGALALIMPGEVRTVLEHGFPAPEKVMTATTTVGNRIVNIDWQPAFEVYRDVVRSESGVVLDQVNFYQWAVGFPFGILRANGELLVRIPVALSGDGCIECIGEIMENAMMVVLRAPTYEDSKCAEQLCEKLRTSNPGWQGGSLLVFYCAGRRIQLGDASIQEIRRLGLNSGAQTLAGALSLGEIGSTTAGGYPLFHNATLVCTPLVSR